MIGDPEVKQIIASFVERQILTIRMSMSRFASSTNGFSKEIKNYVAAIALHFGYNNFALVHLTLKTTPAVATGIADRTWTASDSAGLLEAQE